MENFGATLLMEGVETQPPLLPQTCHTCSKNLKLDSYTLPKVDPKIISIRLHTP